MKAIRLLTLCLAPFILMSCDKNAEPTFDELKSGDKVDLANNNIKKYFNINFSYNEKRAKMDCSLQLNAPCQQAVMEYFLTIVVLLALSFLIVV